MTQMNLKNRPRRGIFAAGLLSALLLTMSHLASGADKEWKQLFIGKDLTGWQHVRDGGMTVEGGFIATHGNPNLTVLAHQIDGKPLRCVPRHASALEQSQLIGRRGGTRWPARGFMPGYTFK